MEERRGQQGFSTRELHYCDRCKATSAFESQLDDTNRTVLVCVGDQRSPNLRPGCGKVIFDTGVKRYYGDCMACKQVRRAIKMPDGTFRCVVCGGVTQNPESAPYIP